MCLKPSEEILKVNSIYHAENYLEILSPSISQYLKHYCLAATSAPYNTFSKLPIVFSFQTQSTLALPLLFTSFYSSGLFSLTRVATH